MKWSKTIMALMIFYGLIGFGVTSIGASLRDEQFKDMASILDPSINWDDYNIDIESYQWLVQDSANKMGIDIFRLGEFNVLPEEDDAISVAGVWSSTEEVWENDDFKIKPASNWWNWWYNWMRNPDYWVKKVQDAHMSNISASEPVYIYPYFYIELEGGFFDLPNLNQFIILKAWDVYDDYWFTEMISMAHTWDSDITIVAKLKATDDMPKHDLYYCIDFVVCDTDLGDYFDIERALSIGKADIVERYGGVVYGDESVASMVGSQMTPHTISKSPTGGITSIFRVLGDFVIGFKSFQGYNHVSTLFNITIFTPMILLIGYIIYTEIKSLVGLLPFSGGGG